jgi:hypothetical protein
MKEGGEHLMEPIVVASAGARLWGQYANVQYDLRKNPKLLA